MSSQFKILHKLELSRDSTAYIEFGEGKHDSNFWKFESKYVNEGEFILVEKIIKKFMPKFDHYSSIDIPKKIGLKIIKYFRMVAKKLKKNFKDGYNYLFLIRNAYWEPIILKYKDKIIEFLNDLANTWNSFYQTNEWIFIHGM